jgi:signal peptidase II
MQRLRRAGFLVLAAATAALDLWSKALWDYPAGPPDFDGALAPTNRTVVENWVYVHTKWNPGGAWSAKLPDWLLLSGTVVAVPLIAAWIFWPRRVSAWDTAAKSLVLGGAIGNLYDRWTWGQVRDFIDVCFGGTGGWHYPTFNVADVALVVGIAMLLLGGLRKRPPEAA